MFEWLIKERLRAAVDPRPGDRQGLLIPPIITRNGFLHGTLVLIYIVDDDYEPADVQVL